VERPLVLDASALARPVVHEPGADEVLRILGNNTVHCPDFVLTECTNVVWKSHVRGDIDAEEAMQRVLGLRRLPLTLHTTSDLLPATLMTAMRTGHAIYDCLYIALAEQEDATLVTDDTAQAEAARSLGVKVRMVRKR
jgi:predicted nucleic acid-binding protein